MLAGPNGSGKSSLVPQLQKYADLGVSVNADEIEADLNRQSGLIRVLNLYDWRLQLTSADLLLFGQLSSSQRLPTKDQAALKLEHNVLLFQQAEINSYLAAWVAEFLRYNLLRAGHTMTFETVMSHPSKLDFLREAKAFGYRTYLYFVATNDPNLNVARVQARVEAGGHAVAVEKILERYYRSLKLSRDAIKLTDRAYFFDNSGDSPQLIAEVTNGKNVTYKTELAPEWVKKILS